MLSKPAFSAKVLGTISKDSANAVTANCSLPLIDWAYSLSFLAIAISGAPPPATTWPSSTVAATTPIASSTALSISSTMCLVLPLTSKVTALGSWHSSTKIMSSPEIFFSITEPAWPKSASVKSSKLVMTFAPVALDNFSMSDFLTLLTAMIPALAK